MSGYYDAIARSVAALGETTAATRGALYERARSALAAQIRSADQSLKKEDFDRAVLALQDAIQRVEQECVNRQTPFPQQTIAEVKSPKVEETIRTPPPSSVIQFLASRLRLNKSAAGSLLMTTGDNRTQTELGHKFLHLFRAHYPLVGGAHRL